MKYYQEADVLALLVAAKNWKVARNGGPGLLTAGDELEDEIAHFETIEAVDLHEPFLMKIWIVGQNPKTEVNKAIPFLGTPSGKPLGKWLASVAPQAELVASNACEDFYPKRPNSKDLARLRAYYEANRCRKVIAVGMVASQALAKAGIPHFALPHPSGLNRQNNDSQFVAQKLQELWDYLWRY